MGAVGGGCRRGPDGPSLAALRTPCVACVSTTPTRVTPSTTQRLGKLGTTPSRGSTAVGFPRSAQTTACGACFSHRSCGSSRGSAAVRGARTRTARMGTRRGAPRGGTRGGGTDVLAYRPPMDGNCADGATALGGPCPRKTARGSRTRAARTVSTPVSAGVSTCRSGTCTSRVCTRARGGTRGAPSVSGGAFTISGRPCATTSGFTRTLGGPRRGRSAGTRTTCAVRTTTVPRSTARAPCTRSRTGGPFMAGTGSGASRPSACGPTPAGSAARRSSPTPATA